MTVTAPFPQLRRGLVAILRGLKPDEAIAVGEAVFKAGIEAIGVEVNRPTLDDVFVTLTGRSMRD